MGSRSHGWGLISEVQSFYDWAMSQGDPRTQDWLFTRSPVPSLIAIAIYLLVVYYGPKVMKNRKPVNLGHTLTVYNFALIGLSAYMTYEFFMSAYLAGYGLGCQPVDYSYHPLALRMASVCWVFYISKFIETFDTVFFILRKKNNQLTFLHVFHHSTMIFNWWMCVKYIPGGSTTFHATVNSFVHMVMYTYYALSALGPWIQPYLWWKKYVTFLQLGQFLANLVHTTAISLTCNFKVGFIVIADMYAIIMIVLFSNYYLQESKRSRLRREQKQYNHLELKSQ